MATNGNGNPDAAVMARSVTRDDFAKTPSAGYGSILNLWFPQPNQQPGLPAYWSPMRDRVLRTTIMQEAMWASAVNIAISKISNRAWRLDGQRVNYWQELLLAADNRQSWTSFTEKLAKDFLLTDNGAYFEIIRANNARGARIIGLRQLPSWRMIPTGNLDEPYIYRDRLGAWHYMKDYQCVRIVDSPENAFTWYNIDIGFCAASRAYSQIVKLAALEQYVYEKVAGKRPLSIYLVNAQIKEGQLQNAIDVQRERSQEQGYVQYMGAVMIPILDPTATPQVGEIKIAGLPDGFDPKEERLHGQVIYADAIGLDPTDLNPELAARGRALGSGSQAQVLDDKGKGKGIYSFTAKLEYMINDRILPPRVMFSTYETDLADDARRATVRKSNIEAARAAVGNGMEPPILTPTQAQNWLADMGELTQDYVTADLTTDDMIRGDEKPLVVDSKPTTAPDAGLMQTEQQPQPQQLNPQQVKAKEANYNRLLNLAEKEMMDVAPDLVPMLTDTELIFAYIQNHPELQQVTRKENTMPITELIEREKKHAAQLYRELLAQH